MDDADDLLSLEELARATGMHPAQIESFVQFGLLEPASAGVHEMFCLAAIDRLRTIMRLRRDLGVNLAGVAAILEMRDRMVSMHAELVDLRRRLGLDE